MRTLAIAAVTTALFAAPAAASEDAASVMSSVNAAMHPAASSTRAIEVTVTAPDNTAVKWVGRQATKRFADGNRSITVLLGPEGVRGFAILVHERKDAGDDVWMYIPPVRRVRKLEYLGGVRTFLGTDFSYDDFGFFSLEGRTFSKVDQGQRNKVAATAIQEKTTQPGLYSRVVTWVADETHLPVEREYFDSAGELWKTEFFEEVQKIQGHPTTTHIRMENKQEGGSSELRVSDVRYDVELPDALFDSTTLAEAVDEIPR